jgi:hypothetical protein
MVFTLVVIVYCTTYSFARFQGRLVHRCLIDENAKRQLTSRGGHHIGMQNISDMAGEDSRDFAYFVFTPLRWTEGLFWSCYYRNGDVLRWQDPRRYN